MPSDCSLPYGSARHGRLKRLKACRLSQAHARIKGERDMEGESETVHHKGRGVCGFGVQPLMASPDIKPTLPNMNFLACPSSSIGPMSSGLRLQAFCCLFHLIRWIEWIARLLLRPNGIKALILTSMRHTTPNLSVLHTIQYHTVHHFCSSDPLPLARENSHTTRCRHTMRATPHPENPARQSTACTRHPAAPPPGVESLLTIGATVLPPLTDFRLEMTWRPYG